MMDEYLPLSMSSMNVSSALHVQYYFPAPLLSGP